MEKLIRLFNKWDTEISDKQIEKAIWALAMDEGLKRIFDAHVKDMKNSLRSEMAGSH